MNEKELERLTRRFGADISTWPAPYRQEAQWRRPRAGEVSAMDEEARIDRLILEAARMETDEGALARKVQERIGQGRGGPVRFASILPAWQLPAVTASFAFMLVMAGLAGYSVGGAGLGRMDEALLALATGDTTAGVLGVGSPVPSEIAGEEGFR